MEPASPRLLTSRQKRAPNSLRGFTLIEMIVVLAIIVVVMGIALLGQSNFNKSLTLTDTAYTVAFSIREAQSLGLSSRIFNSVQNAGYGVHVDDDSTSSYVLYADTYPASPGYSLSGLCPGRTAPAGNPDAKPGNCLYQANQNELVQQYTLTRGYTINRFCGHDASTGTYRCSDDTSNTLDHMDIEFTRPNTQASIIGVTEFAGSEGYLSLSDATLYVQTPDGSSQRCIYVSSLGQVSVATKGSSNCI